MHENITGIKKVDVFNDIVSRLEDSKKARVSDDVVLGMRNYYNTKNEYRSRVTMLAEKLKGIRPIDSEINNVIYLSDFMERGIAIKSSLNSFRQIWVEYRLIYNENSYKEEKVEPKNIEVNLEPKVSVEDQKQVVESNIDLDENYKKLYTKVVNLSKYIEEFNKKKIDLNRQISNLEDKRRKLSNEIEQLENAKREFERYKLEEQQKIDKMKSEVNSKVLSLQNLIDNLDNILEKVS